MAKILIAGGYGVVGSWVARLLRAEWPNLGLILAGRQPEAGEAFAREIGADLVQLDVGAPQPGLAAAGQVDLVVAALQDPDDRLLLASLEAGSAHIGIVRNPDSMGTSAVAAISRGRSPALLAGHWQAGVATLAALTLARSFRRVDRVEVSALYDYADPIGPMTAADSGGFFSTALVRSANRWVRLDPSRSLRSVSRSGGPSFTAQPMSILDTPSIAAATGAADVRFDLGSGDSLGVLAGGAASHEIYVDVWGRGPQDETAHERALLSDPRGQAHLTAAGVLLGVERLLGLDGLPPATGSLLLPETIIDPVRAMTRLGKLGVRFGPDVA